MASCRPKTTTFASGARGRFGLAVALAAAAAAAGCEGGGCPPSAAPMVTTSIECRAEGGAQVSSPTLALPATVAPGFGATTCLQVDLTCSGESVVAFGSTGQGGDGNVYFGLRIPASDAPGTYPLTSDSERFRPGLATDGVSYTGDLTVTSGTLVVTRNDAAHFAATFAVELETTDGLHRVSLSNGAISVGFCTRVTRSGCWAAN